jgi:hypothetical protein
MKYKAITTSLFPCLSFFALKLISKMMKSLLLAVEKSGKSPTGCHATATALLAL